MRVFIQIILRTVQVITLLAMTRMTNAQTVTITAHESPLETILRDVEKQTGFSFIYTSEALSQTRPVTISVTNENLVTFLNGILKDQPLAYQIRDRHIILRKAIFMNSSGTQKQMLDGMVVTTRGEPAAGITISIQGTDYKTVTNNIGRFRLPQSSKGLSLFISGAEIENEKVIVSGDSAIKITVRERVTLLDETIVIAYGKTTRRLNTGTVEKLTATTISQQPVSNPVAALIGRISGLQLSQTSGAPGTSYRIRIRGQNSIANGNDPLFVVDGIPYPSHTLNGKAGGGASNVSTPLDNLNPDIVESIEVLKDADATSIYGSRGANGVILITTKKGSVTKPAVSSRFYSGIGSIARRMKLLATADYLQLRREAFSNDSTVPAIATAPDLLLWDTTRHTDWQEKLIGNTMHITDWNSHFSGGNTHTQFMLAGGFHRETTVYPGTFASNKYSGSISAGHSSKDHRLSIDGSASYLLHHNILPREDLSVRIMLPPNAPATHTPDGFLNWQNNTWMNPMAAVNRTFRSRTGTWLANFTMTYKLPWHLSARLSFSYSGIDADEHSVTPSTSFMPLPTSTPGATFGSRSMKTLIAAPQLTWNGKIHRSSLEVLAGLEMQRTEERGLYQNGSGYASDDLLNSLQSASRILVIDEIASRYRYIGAFTRSTYRYNEKYLLTVTMRRDGSSRYGPQNRFATFGSIASGWIFTKEKFLRHLHWLSFGKIKASFGVTGNDQIGDYRYIGIYDPSPDSYLGQPTLFPRQLFNPGYAWEKVTKREIGLEIGAINDRLLLAVQYYHNTTSNQLINYSLPGTTGFSSIIRNIPARIRNNGIECRLTGQFTGARVVQWSGTFTVTVPRNKLLSFQQLSSSSYAAYYVTGKPLSIEKTLQLTGVDPVSGVYTFHDYNQDRIIDMENDRQFIVTTSQSFYGGLEQTLKIKRLSFSFFLQFVRQPHAPGYVRMFSRPGITGNQPTLVLDRWQVPGDQASIQRYAYNGYEASIAYSNLFFSNGAYSDASFVRCRSLYVAWNCLYPKIRNAGFSEAQLFLQGQNLFTLSRYNGLDPETNFFLPPIRILTVGIQVRI